ncbi:MAG: hypothetical protein MZW92_59860 [Comamonadaceae bacterium]|nr:hypothetical protein [Comamonadaceae bacterium]
MLAWIGWCRDAPLSRGALRIGLTGGIGSGKSTVAGAAGRAAAPRSSTPTPSRAR